MITLGLDISFYEAESYSTVNSKGENKSEMQMWEIAALGNMERPVLDYFKKKFKFDADEDDYLILEENEIKEFLKTVDENKLFEYSDYSNWIERHFKYFYRISEDGKKKIPTDWIKNDLKSTEITDEDIIRIFHRDLKNNLSNVYETVELGGRISYSYSH